MQDHGHFFPADTGRQVQAPAHGGAELLQPAAESAGEGVGPVGENDLIMRGLDGIPAEMARVVPGEVELGVHGEDVSYGKAKGQEGLSHKRSNNFSKVS